MAQPVTAGRLGGVGPAHERGRHGGEQRDPRLIESDATALLDIRTGAATPAGQHLFGVLAARHGVSTTAESTLTIRSP